MSLRLILLAIVALVMVVPLVPLTASQAQAPSLSAGWSGIDIKVTVTLNAPFEGSVILKHVDPTGVVRVDGFSRLSASNGGMFEVSFRAPQGDVQHEVALLPTTAEHRLAGSSFWDDAGWDGVTPLATAAVPLRSGNEATLTLRALSGSASYAAANARVAASPEGAIAVAYQEGTTIWATASADGGQTWPVRTALLSGFGDHNDSPLYDVAFTGSSTFTFVMHHSIRDQPTDWNFVRVDLAAGSIVTSSVPQPEQSSPNPWSDPSSRWEMEASCS